MQPDPFDPDGQSSFEEYVRQWEKYFRVQKVTDADEKRDVFVDGQDDAVFGVIIRVCTWKKLEDTSFEDICNKLFVHFDRQGKRLQHLSDEGRRQSEQIKSQGEKCKRQGLKQKRQGGEEVSKGAKVLSGAEEVVSKSEEFQSLVEQEQRQGEHLCAQSEEKVCVAEEIQSKEDVQCQGEQVQRPGDEVKSQSELQDLRHGELGEFVAVRYKPVVFEYEIVSCHQDDWAAKSTIDLVDRVSWASDEAPVVVEGGEGVLGKLKIAQVSGALSPRQGGVQVPEELSSMSSVEEVEPLGEQVQWGLKSEEAEEEEREEVKLVAAQVNYALSPGQVMVLAGQQWSEHQPDQVCLQPVTTIVKEELPQVDPDPQEGLPEMCDLRLEEYAGSSSPARKSSSLRGAGPSRPAQEGQSPGWPVPADVEEERPQVDPDPHELQVVAQKVKVEEGPGQRQQVPMFVEEKLPQVDPDPPVKVQLRLEEVPWSSSSPVKLASPVRMGPRRPSKVTVKLKVSISKVGGSNCFLWPTRLPLLRVGR